jgi:hypothetical protein
MRTFPVSSCTFKLPTDARISTMSSKSTAETGQSGFAAAANFLLSEE